MGIIMITAFAAWCIGKITYECVTAYKTIKYEKMLETANEKWVG